MSTAPTSGPWVVKAEQGVTFCDGPHPMRLGRNPEPAIGRPVCNRNIAIANGRKGYMCEGGEEHSYRCWAVYNKVTDEDDNIYDFRDEAYAAADRLNREEAAKAACDGQQGHPAASCTPCAVEGERRLYAAL